MPIKAIARVMGISKNTVKAALASAGPTAREPADTRYPQIGLRGTRHSKLAHRTKGKGGGVAR